METTTHTRRSYPIIPDRIVEARMNTALTQEELAGLVGCGVRTLRDWELGVHAPFPRFVRALSDKLDVSVPWLRGLN